MSEQILHTTLDTGASSAGPNYYVLHAVTKQTSGPLSEETIQDWISQKRITLQDSVTRQGEQHWTPILQSPFGTRIADQANLDRLAATTCPRCGSAMVARIKQSGTGLALILIGIALTPLFIGIPIFIVGMVMRHGGKGGKAYFSCPICSYSTS